MKDIVTDLCDRMAMLHNRYDVVFATPTAPAAPPYIPNAEALARGLRGRVRQAVSITRALVDPGDMERPEFWATELGQLLFAAGGYQSATVSQAMAAALLGVSRQRVGQLVQTGKLASTILQNPRLPRGGSVRAAFTEQVQEMLQAKLDKGVNGA